MLCYITSLNCDKLHISYRPLFVQFSSSMIWLHCARQPTKPRG